MKSQGFTILELLVAIGILDSLVAFAIPQYITYRRHTFIAQVKSDLKNASIVQKIYFTETELTPIPTYPPELRVEADP